SGGRGAEPGSHCSRGFVSGRTSVWSSDLASFFWQQFRLTDRCSARPVWGAGPAFRAPSSPDRGATASLTASGFPCWQQPGAFFCSCPLDEVLLQQQPPSPVEQQHLPLQQQDDSEETWPEQNGLTVPSGQRQTKCGVLPRADETAVAQTRTAVTV